MYPYWWLWCSQLHPLENKLFRLFCLQYNIIYWFNDNSPYLSRYILYPPAFWLSADLKCEAYVPAITTLQLNKCRMVYFLKYFALYVLMCPSSFNWNDLAILKPKNQRWGNHLESLSETNYNKTWLISFPINRTLQYHVSIYILKYNCTELIIFNHVIKLLS